MTLQELQLRLIYARDFMPHKVIYYEILIQDKIKSMEAEKMNSEPDPEVCDATTAPD